MENIKNSVWYLIFFVLDKQKQQHIHLLHKWMHFIENRFVEKYQKL